MKLAAGNPTEPDELAVAYLSGFYDGRKKRPWVGLTDDEIDNLSWGFNARDFARSTEAKLKEKNT